MPNPHFPFGGWPNSEEQSMRYMPAAVGSSGIDTLKTDPVPPFAVVQVGFSGTSNGQIVWSVSKPGKDNTELSDGDAVIGGTFAFNGPTPLTYDVPRGRITMDFPAQALVVPGEITGHAGPVKNEWRMSSKGIGFQSLSAEIFRADVPRMLFAQANRSIEGDFFYRGTPETITDQKLIVTEIRNRVANATDSEMLALNAGSGATHLIVGPEGVGWWRIHFSASVFGVEGATLTLKLRKNNAGTSGSQGDTNILAQRQQASNTVSSGPYDIAENFENVAASGLIQVKEDDELSLVGQASSGTATWTNLLWTLTFVGK